jgi:hypothetical protein
MFTNLVNTNSAISSKQSGAHTFTVPRAGELRAGDEDRLVSVFGVVVRDVFAVLERGVCVLVAAEVERTDIIDGVRGVGKANRTWEEDGVLVCAGVGVCVSSMNTTGVFARVRPLDPNPDPGSCCVCARPTAGGRVGVDRFVAVGVVEMCVRIAGGGVPNVFVCAGACRPAEERADDNDNSPCRGVFVVCALIVWTFFPALINPTPAPSSFPPAPSSPSSSSL